MSALLKDLTGIIEADGPISLERYMALALGHPRYGYYMTRDPLGASGDFVTSPEISQMFGELLGLWAAEVWAMMGSPSPVLLVELGPGRGTLMADALRAASISPGFKAALQVHLVETSPSLVARQRETLSGVEVNWHESIEQLPEGPAIFLANEFFDALPVRHFVRTKRGWCERVVGLDEQGGLMFGASNDPESYITVPAQEGDILEVAAISQRIMTTLAARIMTQGGALLAIDYGHTQTVLGETLQGVKDHEYFDVLSLPGEVDLTTHVDFAALGRAAKSTGARVHGPVMQGEFLARLGILQRADALMARGTPDQAREIDVALERLVAPEPVSGPGACMGSLFKVIAVTQKSIEAVPGIDAPVPEAAA